jgi:hypothetical protein
MLFFSAGTGVKAWQTTQPFSVAVVVLKCISAPSATEAGNEQKLSTVKTFVKVFQFFLFLSQNFFAFQGRHHYTNG